MPGYLSESGDAPASAKHYHPTIAIVVYVRDHVGDPSHGRVTKMLVPPANIGVYTLHSKQRENWVYRRIHSHDESGVIHVEPKPGHVLRICNLLKLWHGAVGSDRPFDDLEPHKRVRVLLDNAKTLQRNTDDFQMLPLNSNRRIIVLVEEGRMM